MNLYFRSTSFAFAVHASALVAMCAVPLAVSERFTSSGQRNVISIQLSIAQPAAVESVAMTIEPTPPLPREDPIEFQTDRPAPLLHRPPVPPTPPEVTPQTMPVVRRAVASRMLPPTATTIPIQQQTGLSEKEPASFTANEPPQYPSQAVRDRLQGTVLLRLFVDSTGRVEDVEVVESSGHATLDDAAMEAVKRWTGQPARRYGRPVASEEVLPIRFRL
ncbi:transport protein TonB [Rosistilla carotiformis]|uniref:Transport protein TonB n=1 Tax=Rosistilla carotiformis TaxID=2528017 RepID=A0A518JVV1_9BACT|nr:energy transducer TonB [Rosistilla carotiformis]QDV69667.1 transport protein TonB [Rosistilla carotiformis]